MTVRTEPGDEDQYHEKYVVYKSEDGPTHLSPGEQLEPGTYFVIRSSDLFAPAAMYAYANNIRTLLEAQHRISVEHDVRGILSLDEVNRLERLSDQMVELANDWEHAHGGKVPD